MNLPNIGYFNYRPTYAGSPINETEKYYSAIADSYTANRDSYDVLQIAMANTTANSESERKYIDTVKNSINESLKKVAKDTQGNIRFEQANQVVRNMAIKYATDETLLKIKDRYTKQELAEKQKLALAASGHAPVGFGIDDGEGLTFDEKGKPVVKEFKGWYEPQGAYSKGYSEILNNLSIKDREELRRLNTKKSTTGLTPDEEKLYNYQIESIYQKVPQLAETNQDLRQLKSKGYTDEEAKKFIIENRLNPRINEQSDIEKKIEYQDAMLQNQIEKQNHLAELTEDRQRKLANEAYARKLDMAEKTGKIKKDANGNYVPANGDTTGSGQADILFTENEGGIQSTKNEAIKIDERAFDVNGNTKSDYIANTKSLTDIEYLKLSKSEIDDLNKNYNLSLIPSGMGRMVRQYSKKGEGAKTINEKISKQKEHLIKIGYPDADKLKPKDIANIYNTAIDTDQNRVQKLIEIASPKIIAELEKSGFIYTKPEQLPLGKAGLRILGEYGDTKTLTQRGIKVDNNKDSIRFVGFTKTGNETEDIGAGSMIYELKQGDGKFYKIAIPPNLMDSQIAEGFKSTDVISKVFNKTPITNDESSYNEKYAIKPSSLGFTLNMDKDLKFMSVKSINNRGSLESELIPFVYDDDTKKFVNIDDIKDNQEELTALKSQIKTVFGNYTISFSDLEKRNEATLLRSSRIQGAIRSSKTLEEQFSPYQRKSVEQIINEED